MGKKADLLDHIPKASSQRDGIHICYILAVHQHLSFVRIIEPVGQFEKGGLAAAR